jgi:hypothetical protein
MPSRRNGRDAGKDDREVKAKIPTFEKGKALTANQDFSE